MKFAALAVVLVSASLLSTTDIGAQGGGAGDTGGEGSGLIEWPIEGFLIDCRDVDCFQRETCNRRVRAAINQIKTSAADIAYSRSDITTRAQRDFQRERIWRLESFVAPQCNRESNSWTLWSESLGKGFSKLWAQLWPKSTSTRSAELPVVKHMWAFPPGLGGRVKPAPDEAGTQAASQTPADPWFQKDWRTWLKGRWEGWLSLDDGRSASIWLQITGVTSEGFVKACTDHGMVMASVDEDGVLSVPRRARFDLGARLMLWRTPPYYEDLQGLVVVEIEPGREVQNGNAWLSRALSAEFSADLTDYPCQSPELLDRRRDLWFPDR